MKDLFTTPELIPANVQAILDKYTEIWEDSTNLYTTIASMYNELEAIGYIFDSGLDADPYNLRELKPLKTPLPTKIETIEEAKQFLTALYNNGEAYHPEDDALDIESIWNASEEQKHKLNSLMEQCQNLTNDNFDPCEFLLELTNPERMKAIIRVNEISAQITTLLNSGVNSANNALAWIQLHDERSKLVDQYTILASERI